ncbi:MAG TPA: DNA adenine methylase [Fervidobacterium sp.]|nr:DNA adenine methylase [Fervidobacterium sp.]
MNSKIANKRLNFFWYMGGKSNLLKPLLSILPEHVVYVEVFGGAGNLLLNKKPVHNEIINDVDDDIVNLFTVVSRDDTFEQFNKIIQSLPYSRTVHQKMREILKEPFEYNPFEPNVQRAVAYYYFKNSSVSGMGGFGVTRSGNHVISISYANKLDKLKQVRERLRKVIVEHVDFEECIRKYDTPDTLFFLDPPYLNAEHYYKHGFTIEDHKRLLNLLPTIKGKFILTTYRNELYENALRNFYCLTVSNVKHSAANMKKKDRVEECIYTNFEPATSV